MIELRPSQLLRRIRQAVSKGLCLLIILCTAFSQPASAGADTFRVKDGVVSIANMYEYNGESLCSTGSGFGVGTVGKETEIFVTNRHVVSVTDEDGEEIGISREVYILLDDNALTLTYDIARYPRFGEYLQWNHADLDSSKAIRCRVLFPSLSDPKYPDIAILCAEKPVPGRIALPIIQSTKAVDGMRIQAIGYPGAADASMSSVQTGEQVFEHVSGSSDSSTITEGIISRRLRFQDVESTWVLQHTAHLSSGNSGGPLLTEEGIVVGINTYGIKINGETQYNLAIFSDYAMRELDRLNIPYNLGWDPDEAAESPQIKTSAPPSPEEASNTAEDQQDIPEAVAVDRSKTAPSAASDIFWIVTAGVFTLTSLIFMTLLIRQKRHTREFSPGSNTARSFSTQNPGIPTDSVHKTAYRLQGLRGYYAGRRFQIDGTVQFGRTPGANTLVYPNSMSFISRIHCRLYVQGDFLYLQDLGSTGGTFCNGYRLLPQQPVLLNIGDRFWLCSPEESFLIDRSSTK